jgi:hypothetical protein
MKMANFNIYRNNSDKMCGRGRSTYTIPGIQRIVGGRPVPRRLYGRGAAHILRMRDTSSNATNATSHANVPVSNQSK